MCCGTSVGIIRGGKSGTHNNLGILFSPLLFPMLPFEAHFIGGGHPSAPASPHILGDRLLHSK